MCKQQLKKFFLFNLSLYLTVLKNCIAAQFQLYCTCLRFTVSNPIYLNQKIQTHDEKFLF
jgi:hypothetical protein